MLRIQITEISTQYSPEGELELVNVYFNIQSENGNIHAGGYVPVAAADYEGNESFASLRQIVKNHFIDNLE